jgi:hypothetical protein
MSYLGQSLPTTLSAPSTMLLASGNPYLMVVGAALKVAQAILPMIGRGRSEADAIVPFQNQVGAALAQINRDIGTANIAALQSMYQVTIQIGNQFKAFVAEPVFVDGRASTQALNTIMPLIDGTCGYTSKNSGPTETNCGPAGPAGTNGTLGSIVYQINLLQGGSTLAPPQLTQTNGASYYPTLQSPSLGGTLPQPGTLPYYPPNNLTSVPAAIVNTGLFDAGNLPLIVGGVLLFLAFRRKG